MPMLTGLVVLLKVFGSKLTSKLIPIAGAKMSDKFGAPKFGKHEKSLTTSFPLRFHVHFGVLW